MPTYVTLARWTDQAAQSVREGPQRRERLRRAIEGAGGRIIGGYVTQGRYDVIFITEFPSDEAATATLLGVAASGELRTETLRAFTPEEMDRLFQQMPSP
jgi:uncharacterized protein with GYD domain